MKNVFAREIYQLNSWVPTGMNWSTLISPAGQSNHTTFLTHIVTCQLLLPILNPFIPVSAKTATSQVDLQV